MKTMGYIESALVDKAEKIVRETRGAEYNSANVLSIEWGNIGSCAWGKTKRSTDGTFEIALSAKLRSANENAILTTLVHEMLHTCPGCFSHTGKWKQLAADVSKRTGLRVQRLNSYADMGLEVPPLKECGYKYAVKCNKCGGVIARRRMTAVIRFPNMYSCGLCGGELTRIDI